MNFVNLKCLDEDALMRVEDARQVEGANLSACAYCRLRSDQLEGEPCTSAVQADTCRNTSRAHSRRYLHTLYRETLPDYREPTSDWMKQFSRRTLQNIWENYKETRA